MGTKAERKTAANLVYIYDREFNTIEVPVKVPSGKVVYDVNKILKKMKPDKKTTEAATALMDKLGKKIRPYYKIQAGENIPQAFNRALMDAFAEGKISLSEMSEMNTGNEEDEEITAFNRTILIELFIYIVDYDRLPDFVNDEKVRKELADAEVLYQEYPVARILNVVQSFLQIAGLK